MIIPLSFSSVQAFCYPSMLQHHRFLRAKRLIAEQPNQKFITNLKFKKNHQKPPNLQLQNFQPYCQMHHHLDLICMIYCAYVFSLSPSPELFPIEAISAAGACRLSLSFPTCKISSAESKSLSAYSLIFYFFYPSIAKLCCSVTTAYCRKKLISTSNSILRLHTNMCH